MAAEMALIGKTEFCRQLRDRDITAQPVAGLVQAADQAVAAGWNADLAGKLAAKPFTA